MGNTACHLAAVTGNCEVILLLLNHGASLRVLDSQGRSPLHLAAWSGQAACVKLLLDNAMDMLNVKTTCRKDKKEMHQQVKDLWKHDQVCTTNEVSRHQCNTGFWEGVADVSNWYVYQMLCGSVRTLTGIQPWYSMNWVSILGRDNADCCNWVQGKFPADKAVEAWSWPLTCI